MSNSVVRLKYLRAAKHFRGVYRRRRMGRKILGWYRTRLLRRRFLEMKKAAVVIQVGTVASAKETGRHPCCCSRAGEGLGPHVGDKAWGGHHGHWCSRRDVRRVWCRVRWSPWAFSAQPLEKPRAAESRLPPPMST